MKFNRPIWLGLPFFAVIAAAYLYVSQMENRRPVSFQHPTSEDEPEKVQKAFDLGEESQMKIASILYSDLSKEEMLEKLKPYVKLGDSLGKLTKRTVTKPTFGFGSGPRNPGSKRWDYNFFCGLEIGTDDNGDVCRIARSKNTVNNKDYESLLIAP